MRWWDRLRCFYGAHRREDIVLTGTYVDGTMRYYKCFRCGMVFAQVWPWSMHEIGREPIENIEPQRQSDVDKMIAYLEEA